MSNKFVQDKFVQKFVVVSLLFDKNDSGKILLKAAYFIIFSILTLAYKRREEVVFYEQLIK